MFTGCHLQHLLGAFAQLGTSLLLNMVDCLFEMVAILRQWKPLDALVNDDVIASIISKIASAIALCPACSMLTPRGA